MKTYHYSFFTFCLCIAFSFTSCNNDDFDPDNFQQAELGDTDCISERQAVISQVSKVSGLVVFYRPEDADFELVLIKDSSGKMYMPCGLPEQYEKNGLQIMFSGTIYGGDPTALTIYYPNNAGYLKLAELWVPK